jgi:hypothetical protein
MTIGPPTGVTGRVGGLYSLSYGACGVIHIHWIYVLAIKVYTSTLHRGGKMKRLLPILSVITWAIASHPRNPVNSGSKLSPCLRAPPPGFEPG